MNEVQAFIVENVIIYPSDIVTVTAEKFGVSQQAVAKHMKKLIVAGTVVRKGRTRGAFYQLKGTGRPILNAQITEPNQLEEHAVWEAQLREPLKNYSGKLRYICEYGVTEMLNNVKDHATATSAGLSANKIGRQRRGQELRQNTSGCGAWKKSGG